MKKLFMIFALLSFPAFAQNGRWDLQATTVQAQGGNLLPVYAIPGATVSFLSCSSGLVTSCTTPATTFNGAGDACPSDSQVNPQGSLSCTNTADTAGNFGAFFANGTYAYTLTANGSNYGPFLFSVGSGRGSGTVTSFSSGNLHPLFSTSVATSTTTPALSFTLSSQAANTFFRGPLTGSDATPVWGYLDTQDFTEALANDANFTIHAKYLIANDSVIYHGGCAGMGDTLKIDYLGFGTVGGGYSTPDNCGTFDLSGWGANGFYSYIGGINGFQSFPQNIPDVNLNFSSAAPTGACPATGLGVPNSFFVLSTDGEISYCPIGSSNSWATVDSYSLGDVLSSSNGTLGAGGGTGAIFGFSTGSVDGSSRINVTTGSSPSVSASIISVTFQGAPRTGFCVMSPIGTNQSGLEVGITSTTTGFSLNSSTTALLPSVAYVWQVSCP